MNRILLLFTILLTLPIFADENPPAKGFDLEGSDPQAIEIADSVMKALGGRENWDNTRFVTWKFFGRRLHVWDKWSGDYRLESNDLTVLMNLKSGNGRAWQAGVEITQADSLSKTLKRAHSIWINDSYWMFFPYKLKDSGVTLIYVGEGKDQAGNLCDILQLTFKNVGDTPQNKYLAYVDRETNLLSQWDFFSAADDEEPRFNNPWTNWRQHGGILLSAERGKYTHSDIAVYREMPPKVFSDPASVDFSVLKSQ